MREIDLKGYKHGKWTIIDKLPRIKGKSGSTRWICRCECGTEIEKYSYAIRNNWISLDCGCSRTLVGKKFNHLTVIKRLLKQGAFEGNYICRCDCGREKKYRGIQIISETVKTCGCGRKKSVAQNGQYLVWLSYKMHAKKRGLVFELNKEKIIEIIQKPCVYCGKTETNKTCAYKRQNNEEIYLHNGIDRLDNTKGYTYENSVPCCKFCNHMKWNLSINEWMEHMKKALEYTQKQQPAMAG